jgi:hypothetical protein
METTHRHLAAVLIGFLYLGKSPIWGPSFPPARFIRIVIFYPNILAENRASSLMLGGNVTVANVRRCSGRGRPTKKGGPRFPNFSRSPCPGKKPSPMGWKSEASLEKRGRLFEKDPKPPKHDHKRNNPPSTPYNPILYTIRLVGEHRWHTQGSSDVRQQVKKLTMGHSGKTKKVWKRT